MGISGELKQLKPLYRLVTDFIPERKTVLELRSAASGDRRRAASAERRLDQLRERIEVLLCDEPSRNEIMRELERMMADTQYGSDFVV